MQERAGPRRSWTGAAGRLLAAFRDFLVRHLGEHISPNSLTLVGVFLALGCGLALAHGHFRLGALLLLLSSLFDVLDGAVARLNGLSTRFGAFWDSTLDRISDFFIFGGLIWFYAWLHDFLHLTLALGALGGAVLVSYTRARAECLIPACRVGFCERPERIGILTLGTVLGKAGAEAALWVLVVLTTLTWVHRVWHTYLQLEGAAFARKPMARNVQAVLRVVFWDHRRASVAYDFKLGLILVFVVGYALVGWLQPGTVMGGDVRFRFSLLDDVRFEPESLGQGQWYVSLERHRLERGDTDGKNALIRMFHDYNPELVFDRWEEDPEAGEIKGFYYRARLGPPGG